MRKFRVHVDTEFTVGARIALPQAQSHYLKHVLRLKPGAEVLFFNGREAREYTAKLISDGKQLGAQIESVQPVSAESPLHSEILQGLGRADHMDWMIQKTTELGANRIVLFPTERTQTTIKSAQLQKKLLHWQSVSISACEQSGRSILPEILYFNRLDQALDACLTEHRLLLEFTGASLQSVLRTPSASVAVLLGPEGGLNPAEIDLVISSDFTPVRMGPRVLRTETAATSALTIVQALCGDLT